MQSTALRVADDGNTDLAVAISHLGAAATDVARSAELLRILADRHPENASSLDEPAGLLYRLADDAELLKHDLEALRTATCSNSVWVQNVRAFAERCRAQRASATELVNMLSVLV